MENIFLESAIKRFNDYKILAEKALDQLDEKDLHILPNEASNSIAVIMKHLHGNMLSRWTNFLTEDGEKEWRKRDEEFEESLAGREQIMQQWQEGWKVLLDTLKSLSASDLHKTITIRNQPLTVVDAINRQLAHYSYHIGQIVYLARWIRNENWQSLSIPKGKSEDYNKSMERKS